MSYRHHHHHHCHHDSGGCLIMAGILLVLGIIAMPVVGLVMCVSGKEEEQGIGVFLIIIGIVIWIMMAASS